MPKAYIIADVRVFDQAGFAKYREAAFPTVGQYGAKPLIVDGKVEQLEGDWNPERLVVVEFDSVEHAKQWYQSPEYSAAIPLRQQAATTNILLVEGV